MSVTGHGAKTGHVRHADDFYATPAHCTRSIVPYLGDLKSKAILEPGCGEGSIIRALPADGYVVGVEIDEARAEAARAIGRGTIVVADFLEWARPYQSPAFDIALGNPPFNLAMDFLLAALKVTHGPVVFLLRLAWLASQKRAPFLRENTPSVYVLPKRPSFTGKGTDSADYAWFMFREPAGPRVVILDTDGAS